MLRNPLPSVFRAKTAYAGRTPCHLRNCLQTAPPRKTGHPQEARRGIQCGETVKGSKRVAGGVEGEDLHSFPAYFGSAYTTEGANPLGDFATVSGLVEQLTDNPAARMTAQEISERIKNSAKGAPVS